MIDLNLLTRILNFSLNSPLKPHRKCFTTKLLLLSSLFLNCQCVSIDNSFFVLDNSLQALEDVFFFVDFIPKADLIMKTARLLGRIYHAFKPLHGSDESQDSKNIEKILSTMKTISSGVKRIETDLKHYLGSGQLVAQISQANTLIEIYELIVKIEINYESF
ncbi:uncharacterized protein LOC116416331 [Nasonia vitripennis]|uniref:Uncharacterized protein n=1 Tax=Nasonia vitripennis TaxID=7425 RepID=A0A7M7Q306_NASVI|nr:uncharacterized protein LOC116416331 [Nasonia vitripennis]XP_031780096.1 uncharacterized protein LOC116416331 [Nasonia vitripennis]